MKAITPIPAGSEIFNDYGALPRSDLLRRYGYITDNYAQYDVVEIPHDLVLQQAAQLGARNTGKRIEYLDEQGLVETGYDIGASDPFDVQESVSPELTALVQTLLLPEAEFERLARKGKLPKPENITPTDMECLRRVVKARAEQYATSLEDDTREPVTVSPGCGPFSKEGRYAVAKLVSIGEKRILRAAEEALARMVEQTSGANGAGKREREDDNDAQGKRQRMK
jgi:SET domain-containing protein 6